MIDFTTGTIAFQDQSIKIGPTLTRSEFLASTLGAHAKVHVANGPHCSYIAHVPEGSLMALPTVLTLSFYHQQLEAVNLMAVDARFGTSWDDWSEDKELARKRFHDDWLIATVATTDRIFPWGQLSSDYDARSGFSLIGLRYSWQGRPWQPAGVGR